MRFIHPLTGKICTAVGVDLDGELWGGVAGWGGVVGEVGAEGVQLGNEYPGGAYVELQRVLKTLAARGILLAICSKNNPDDAKGVLRDRAEMLLRLDDFAAIRINWNDKAENLRSIASELNIGLDSIALVDDGAVEREWVRTRLPEVTIVELPEDPFGFADAVRRSPVFERLRLSDEDRTRAASYREQQQRTEAQQQASSMEDFLASLAMPATFG